ALGLYAAAAGFYVQALPKMPLHRTYRRRAIQLYAEYAGLAARMGDKERATKQLERAKAVDRDLGEQRWYTRIVEGNMLLAAGDPETALALYQEAVGLAAKAAADRQEDMQLRAEWARAIEQLAHLHESLGHRKEVRDAWAKSQRVWQEWPRYGVASVYQQ